MGRLCIIPCGRRKIWDSDPGRGPTPAAEAYLSQFHRNCKAYANAFFAQWIILSAKHGFLHPYELVPGNYDLSFSDPPDRVISPAELRKQATDKGLDRCSHIVMLGGRKFEPVLARIFDQGQTVTFPLRGLKGIGTMNRALAQAVATGQEL